MPAGRVLAGLVASNAHERWIGAALLVVAVAYAAAGVLVERHIARRRLARFDAAQDAAHAERLRLARVNAARRALDDAERHAAERAPCTCPNGCARHPYSVLRSVRHLGGRP